MSRLSCPVCSGSSTENLLSLDCGNLDNSRLYPTVRLASCTICGHAFNELSAQEVRGLDEYYNQEYAPANLNSVVKDGDLPGSKGKFTHDRYSQLYGMLSAHLDSRNAVLDVGCAVGGFLDFLKERGFSKLSGVDMTEAYVEVAGRKNYDIRLGHAEQLPFDGETFDALVIEQVLEHLMNPVEAFREARRVLKPGGVLCIGVPDAARYADLHYFDFYWILMREHVQHFEIGSLSRLAAREGFVLLDHQQTSHPIMGERMVMPNLSALFRKSESPEGEDHPAAPQRPQGSMKEYVREQMARLQQKRETIGHWIASGRPVYVWGVGREFLYLYEAAGLKNGNLAGCIDMNPFKQQTARIGGRKVVPPEILRDAGSEAVLLITAIAHEASIRSSAAALSFGGEIVTLD